MHPIRSRGGAHAPGRASPARAALAALCAAVLIPGCLSADPREDQQRAADLVGARTTIAPAWAAPPPPAELPDPLDLATATRLALEGHPTLRAELATVAAARADLAQADRLPNPTLRFAFGIPIDGGGGEPLLAGIMAPLAALWTRPARLAAADAELRGAVLALADRALRAVEAVRVAFAEVHHGRARAALDARSLALAGERVALVESLFAAGEAERAALDAARIERARAEDRALRSAEEAAVAERMLLELVAAADGECPPLAGAGLGAPDEVPAEEDLIALVATQRLDVAAARARADAARESLERTRRGRYGAADARFEVERDMDDREFVFPGFDLELPIFDAGSAMIARAAADAERAHREAEAVESEALREVRTARARLAGARARLERIESEWLAAARSSAMLAAETAAAGEMSRTDAIAAELDALEAEREQNDAALAASATRFALERAAGGTIAGMGGRAPDGAEAGRRPAHPDAGRRPAHPDAGRGPADLGRMP